MSVSVNKLTFGYSRDVPILRNVDLTVNQGEFALLVGPNGVGKSTFLKLLNGILKPDGGTVAIDTLDTRVTPTPVLASHIAVTFQNPADQIFAATVRHEIMFGPRILKRQKPGLLTERALDLFRLRPFASKHPYDLSPAQRRLLTIASAVATDSPILAFDEPTTSLSQPERQTLLEAFNELKRIDRTILVVSHDLDFFIPVVSKLVVMSNGAIMHVGKPADIVEESQLARAAGLKLPLAMRLRGVAAGWRIS